MVQEVEAKLGGALGDAAAKAIVRLQDSCDVALLGLDVDTHGVSFRQKSIGQSDERLGESRHTHRKGSGPPGARDDVDEHPQHEIPHARSRPHPSDCGSTRVERKTDGGALWEWPGPDLLWSSWKRLAPEIRAGEFWSALELAVHDARHGRAKAVVGNLEVEHAAPPEAGGEVRKVEVARAAHARRRFDRQDVRHARERAGADDGAAVVPHGVCMHGRCLLNVLERIGDVAIDGDGGVDAGAQDDRRHAVKRARDVHDGVVARNVQVGAIIELPELGGLVSLTLHLLDSSTAAPLVAARQHDVGLGSSQQQVRGYGAADAARASDNEDARSAQRANDGEQEGANDDGQEDLGKHRRGNSSQKLPRFAVEGRGRVSEHNQRMVDLVTEMTTKAESREDAMVACEEATKCDSKDVESKDVATLEHAEEAAQRGDGRSAFTASLMRARGVGCEPDRGLALKWLEKAASLGVVKAQTQLAYLYSTGRGGAARDEAEALRWYAEAAEGGDAEALYKLGVRLRDKDYEKALQYWERAAAAGHVKAAERLRSAPRPADVPQPADAPPPPKLTPAQRFKNAAVWLCGSCIRFRSRAFTKPSNPPLVEPLIDDSDAPSVL